MMLYIDHSIWWHQYDERRGGGQQHQHHHQVQFTEYIPVLYIELCTVPVFFGRKYSVSFRHHVISLCTGTVYVRLKLFSGYSNFFKFQPCCIVVLYPFSLKLRKKKALCFDCKKKTELRYLLDWCPFCRNWSAENKVFWPKKVSLDCFVHCFQRFWIP